MDSPVRVWIGAGYFPQGPVEVRGGRQFSPVPIYPCGLGRPGETVQYSGEISCGVYRKAGPIRAALW